MPRNSEYFQALSDDELFAESVIDRPVTAGGSSRRMSEWSVETEMLTNVYDRLGELISVTLAVGGAKKPPKLVPAPRPVTAVDRLRRKRRDTTHRFLVTKLLPHKDTESGDQD